MIRELNESWNAVVYQCILSYSGMFTTTFEVTKVAMATFSNGGLVANTCRGALECDLFHGFRDLGDFFRDSPGS